MVRLLVLSLGFVTAAATGFAQEQASESGKLIDQIEAYGGELGIWWTGHNGWILKSSGIVFATDLVLDDPGREVPSPVSAAELAGVLDISFVTHAHGDHFNGPTSKVLAQESSCLFVLPKSCLEKAASLGIPRERIVVATPRETLTVKGLRVDALRAIHGNKLGAVYFDANLDDCGYVIHAAGKTIMQPGDSVLLEDHLFRKHVDVLFFSPTEHNMQVSRSVILIQALEPDVILPQHRNTYPVTDRNRFWTKAYPHEVKQQLARALQDRYRIVPMGGHVEVSH